MIRVGIAGIGFMGMIHYLAWQRVKGARVTAIASRDEKKLAGDWRSIKGNFGPPGEQMDLTGIHTYAELDQPGQRSGDRSDRCLPAALPARRGDDRGPGGRQARAVRKTDRARFALRGQDGAGGRKSRAAIARRPRAAVHGRVRHGLSTGQPAASTAGCWAAISNALIAEPKWTPDFFDPARVGGPMIDLHIHDAHFIRLLCGMPRAVFTTGRLRDGVAELFTSQFLFDDPRLAVTATSGVIGQQGRSFTHGFEIHLERATLAYDFAVVGDQPRQNIPLTIFMADGKAVQPAVGASDPLDAFAAELGETVRSIRTGRASTLLSGSLARDALLLCEKQTASLAAGRLVKV